MDLTVASHKTDPPPPPRSHCCLKRKGNTTTTTTKGTRIGWGYIALLTYMSVGGGPFGFEHAVASSSPSMALVGLVIVCITVALPVALITAELSTFYPGGYNDWVLAVCGPTVGTVHAMARLCSNLVTAPSYAALFVDYVDGIITPIAGVGWRMFIACCYSAGVFFVNAISFKIVGTAAGVSALLVMFPFVAYFCMMIPRLRGAPFVTFTSEMFARVDWSTFLSTLLFNTTGFDQVSNFAERCDRPGVAFPIGILVALVMMITTYLLPLWSVVSTTPPLFEAASAWEGGTVYTDAIASTSDPWVRWLMWPVTIAGLCSAFGLGTVSTASMASSFQLSSEMGLLPTLASFRWHVMDNVPVANVGFLCLVSAIVSGLINFDSIVAIQMWLYMASVLVELVVFISLRFREAYAHMRWPTYFRPTYPPTLTDVVNNTAPQYIPPLAPPSRLRSEGVLLTDSERVSHEQRFAFTLRKQYRVPITQPYLAILFCLPSFVLIVFYLVLVRYWEILICVGLVALCMVFFLAARYCACLTFYPIAHPNERCTGQPVRPVSRGTALPCAS